MLQDLHPRVQALLSATAKGIGDAGKYRRQITAPSSSTQTVKSRTSDAKNRGRVLGLQPRWEGDHNRAGFHLTPVSFVAILVQKS
jgi:hypothetical protein